MKFIVVFFSPTNTYTRLASYHFIWRYVTSVVDTAHLNNPQIIQQWIEMGHGCTLTTFKNSHANTNQFVRNFPVLPTIPLLLYASRIRHSAIFRFRITSETMNPFIHFCRTSWMGIGPSQYLYLCRTTQHGKTRTYIHSSSGIRTHDRTVQVV